MEAALRALTPKHRARPAERLPDAWLDPLADYESMPLTWAPGRPHRLRRRPVPSGHGHGRRVPGLRRSGRPGTRIASGGSGPCWPACATTGPVRRPSGSTAWASPRPRGYALADFAFVAGAGFSLSFAAGRRRLDVLRLAPADVLLAGGGLSAIAGRAFGWDADVAARPGTVAGCPAVWLASRQGRGWLDVLARLVGRAGRLAVLRHDAASNKLLGAACTASKPVDRDWLASVAAGCVSV